MVLFGSRLSPVVSLEERNQPRQPGGVTFCHGIFGEMLGIMQEISVSMQLRYRTEA